MVFSIHYIQYTVYHWVCKKSNTTSATCGDGTAYLSGAHEFTPIISGVRVARSLVFCVMFCRLLFYLFVLFRFVIVLSVLPRFTSSDYPFGILKLFLQMPRIIIITTKNERRLQPAHVIRQISKFRFQTLVIRLETSDFKHPLHISDFRFLLSPHLFVM
jgi:hypothetical protein